MLRELSGSWRKEAKQIRNRYNDDRLARLNEVHADELDAKLTEWATQTKSLTEASKICGYSVSRLSTMIREGKLKNYGRDYAPKVRVCDLPFKPGYVSPVGLVTAMTRPTPEQARDDDFEPWPE